MAEKKTSVIPGFYNLNIDERLKIVSKYADLSDEEMDILKKTSALEFDQANRMIENVIGTMILPLGIAVNFRVNGKEYLVPYAIEEPSVVAGASNSAKASLKTGGFLCSNTGPIMIGQIQAVNIKDPHGASYAILEHKDEIIKLANEQDPILIKFGGGCIDIRTKVLESITGSMVITELLVDCRDAMGANAINTMTEAVAPLIEKITDGRVYLRIISNLADKRLVRARVVIDKEEIGGEEVVDGVVTAYAFAAADPYRCATHNKGIMNGIDAVIMATCNDWRAIEAGAHSYAARSGQYLPLSTWEKDKDGNLVGTLELPMAVGVVGGATAVHPIAKICRKILGIKTATELAEVIAAVGLAQNLAALRALATVGIQRGHMVLHSRNVAAQAGATGNLIDKVAEQMVKEGKIRADRAKEIVEELSR